MLRIKTVFLVIFVLFTSSCDIDKNKITKKQFSPTKHFEKGYRLDKDGWIYVHIEGEPYERGRQFGYLVAKEYKKAIKIYQHVTYETLGMDYSFFVNQAAILHKNKIPPELIEEMQGMADGLKKAGVKSSLEDIIGWNSWMELTSNWWPQNQKKYTAVAPKGKTASRCSAFIATGKATKDGKIVIGHTTFDDFWNAQFDNIILDIAPSKGYSILMQTQPLFLSSMQDFFITSAGIVGLETTISGFNGYDEKGKPEYVRARTAMQYGKNIDNFIDILNEENNGGVAAIWLIGDTNTNEIAQFQQGLLYQKLDKKKEGYFCGFNAADDPRIRNLECSDEGYNDIRRHTGARRVRWQETMERNYGRIDVQVAKGLLADHHDVYTKQKKPSANTICAHYDEDPRYYMSSSKATNPNPYTPAGSIDAKVTTTDLAKKMMIWARFGRACGTKFDAQKFLQQNPQWNWQKKLLKNRPSQSWVLFSSNKKKKR